MAMNYTPVPHEFLDELDCLSDEEYGRLIRAMQGYFMDGQEPEFPGQERLFWKRCRNTMDRYVESYTARYAANGDNGKKGGRPRKISVEENPSGFSENQKNPPGFEETQKTRMVFDETQKSQTKTKTESKTNTEELSPRKPPLGAGFDEFWSAYPRKVGKQAAWKAWSKLKPSAELTKAILAAVEYQRNCPQWQKDGGQYIPNPATWLNQGRWEDKLPTPADQPQRQTGRPTKADELNEFYAMAAKWAGGDGTP